ncbi:hypothetical protein AB6A40_006505 [Gnathostoma spinigerum]|uniref:Uncharacterized protein n=1 Tax=Gnathostoma spinigerum TaxID=75299 RepID=A0ABD6EQT6_9BILA
MNIHFRTFYCFWKNASPQTQTEVVNDLTQEDEGDDEAKSSKVTLIASHNRASRNNDNRSEHDPNQFSFGISVGTEQHGR